MYRLSTDESNVVSALEALLIIPLNEIILSEAATNGASCVASVPKFMLLANTAPTDISALLTNGRPVI
jgi:hypothetical protein